jgi:hypothetical protein
VSDVVRLLITFALFGEMLGCSGKTARRRWKESARPVYLIGGRTLISRADAEAFIRDHRIEGEAKRNTLKETVAAAVARARARRQAVAS